MERSRVQAGCTGWSRQAFRVLVTARKELVVTEKQRKVAVITGGTRGIGLAIAQRLARDGYDLTVSYHGDDTQADVARSHLEQTGRLFGVLRTDVSAVEGARELIDTTFEKYGRIDVIVNNAGITRDNPLMRMKPEDWNAVIGTNLTGAYNVSYAAVSRLMKQRSGVIINISSVVGRSGNQWQANYAAAKAGLIGFTRALAQELGSRGVRVVAIAPGFIDTRLTDVLPQTFKEELLKRTPLGRFGTPDDVANAVAFLASDEASFITGAVLDVNGGLFMG